MLARSQRLPVACARRDRGAALIEWLVAAPVVLLLGAMLLQWALLLHARHALDFALQQAVRAAVLDHGSTLSARQGLAAGLAPFWLAPSAEIAIERVRAGEAAGWLSWHRSGPPDAVFTDFAQPAVDAFGELIPGLEELPNDNLRFRDDAPGPASGLTLFEANRLRLDMDYGIPLIVPLIGPLVVRTMEMIDGCRRPRPLRLVLVLLHGPSPSPGGSAWTCAFYRAPEVVGGPPVWRLPVRLTAIDRMQSTLRAAETTVPGRLGPPSPTARVGDDAARDPHDPETVPASDTRHPADSVPSDTGPAPASAAPEPRIDDFARELNGSSRPSEEGVCDPAGG